MARLCRRVAWIVGACCAAITTLAHAQIAEPIFPGISVEIADVMQFPDTRNQGTEDSRVRENIARINFLRELPDNTNRWFVNDLRGQLYMVNPQTSIQPYLNFSSQFSRFTIGPAGLATGLISVTPHPAFATNGKFYTIHMETSSGNPGTVDFMAQGNAGTIGNHSVITEWTASNPAANVFAGTNRELLRIATPQGFLHGPGDVAFNPIANPGDADYGLLYIAGGDAGYDAYSKGSPQAQRLDSVFGKILRIDPAGNNGVGGQYGVPSINTYASDGNSATLGEIYATGFRNAHRIMWDTGTGTLFTTDIGQNDIEEINILQPGGNYGWSTREGTFTYSNNSIGPLPPNANSDGFRYPVAQYDHDDFGGDAAIAGGFVYRGTAIPQLQGKFVYGDIVHGRLLYSDVIEMINANDGIATTTADVHELFLTRNGVSVTLEDLVLDKMGESTLPADRHDLRFGQTDDGEIYLITKQDGYIRKLVGATRLEVTVDRTTGAVHIVNPTGVAVGIKGYDLSSISGSLAPMNAAWNSLADQAKPGWAESSATANALAEANANSSLAIGASSSQGIGTPYAPVHAAFGAPGAEDLEFEYQTADGATLTAQVKYTGVDLSNNLVLKVDPSTGRAHIQNTSEFDVSIDGYSIFTDSNSLRPSEWSSLADQDVSDWIEAGPTSDNLSELKPTDSMLVESGEVISLGKIFDPTKPHDLEFEFRRVVGVAGSIMQGLVTYAAVRLPGDYDNDGTVDAADYTLWRDSLGQAGANLPADGNYDGTIDAGDYEIWKSHFGDSDGAGAGTAGQGVPEPTTLGICFCGMMLGFTGGRIRRRR